MSTDRAWNSRNSRVEHDPGAGDLTRSAHARWFIHATIAHAVRPTRRNRLHWASWALALGAELAFVAVLQHGRIYAWEQSLTRFLQGVPGKQLVFDISSTTTNTLSLEFLALFLMIATIVVLSGQRWAALLLLLSFPLHVFAQFPKALMDRPRPSSAFEGIEGVGGLQSFPSGHSEYVVTFYGFLAYLLVLRVRSRWAKLTIIGCWVAFALATGFGRIALGRHWPLDVAASYLVGLGLLSGLIWLHSALVDGANRPAPAPSPRANVSEEEYT